MIKQRIYVIGIGPGDSGYLTQQAKEILQQADVMIGAARMLEIIKKLEITKEVEQFISYLPYEIKGILKHYQDDFNIAILMSGDVGFYSGAKKIIDELPEYQIELIPAISSISYMSAKIKVPWSDMKVVNYHGKKANLVHYINHHKWVFAILSGSKDIYELGEKLKAYNMHQVRLHIGENLSYENERIYSLKPEEVQEYSFESLLVVVVENSMPEEEDFFEIADESFIRGKVPMTKSEVRTVSIAKMHLTKEAIVYDIGAGTGSISIQIGKLYPEAQIYAIEKNPEAVELLKINKMKFKVDGVKIIDGKAPKVLDELPIPTHVLIGGSGGALKEILRLLKQKNPKVRVIVQAITLETQVQIIEICKSGIWRIEEMIQLSVSKAKEIANYHLLIGQNPISIFVLGGSENE